MENTAIKPIQKKTVANKGGISIRLDAAFTKKLSRVVEKANKKSYGRKVTAGSVLKALFLSSDDLVIQRVIAKVQEESLTHADRKEKFFKEVAGKFGGSKIEAEQKMMELFQNYIKEKAE